MKAEVTTALEYGTDRPCQVGRIVYTEGLYSYVALAFRLLEPPYTWRLTWVGPEGKDPARLPVGIEPSGAMLAALAEATG